ncbi:tripartite tricarboxylate transporter TctB family protein [Brenneria tiliae]|uniref:tripartite tricarboxylate transporter TctB family protein n=1 Tax=Brenneria tiliae TaxID=2914984 RepID=UPI002014CCB7|nr:tripartite tricarboxylate transporter TctB family protein [Brenneria tiliae]MCL2898422.1 tripartite tricarboxylate transporter TctB family protein [Brenneria tiliae]MCL2903036.1 tripartite tricarboxylate transporter TctB family protein [Brenneria tiliae]
MDINRQNFYSGLLFIAIGLIFGVGALRSLSFGMAASMGPGCFPLLLSALLLLLGGWIVLGAIKKARSRPAPAASAGESGILRSWRPLVCVLAANCVFGILLKGIPAWGIPAQGLIVSIYALTFIASLASKQHRAGQALALGSILAAGCYVVFIRLMGLPVAPWPDYL